MAHYGYRSYNYMYFCFSDRTSAGHAYQTPNTYFTFYRWYFFAVTANYEHGYYST